MNNQKLYPLSLNQLRQDEVAAFVQRLITDYYALNIENTSEIDFNLLLQNIEDKLPTYLLAINQLKAQAESTQLLQLDTVRDKKLSTLRTALQVYKNTDDLTEKKAYNLLKILMNNYANLAQENYETESINLTQMIALFRDSTHLEASKLLGLERHITVLETANENFKALFSKRSNNLNTTAVYDSKKLNQEIIESYKKLANYVLTMVTIKTNSFYTSVFATINNIRQYYASILATRQADSKPPTV